MAETQEFTQCPCCDGRAYHVRTYYGFDQMIPCAVCEDEHGPIGQVRVNVARAIRSMVALLHTAETQRMYRQMKGNEHEH